MPIVPYNVATGWLQATVTDSEGLTGTETMTIVVGEPFSLEMSPESGKWVVGDTIQVMRRAQDRGLFLRHLSNVLVVCSVQPWQLA